MDDKRSLFYNVKKVIWSEFGDPVTLNQKKLDIAIQYGSSGYYYCVEKNTKNCNKKSLEETNPAMDNLLNNAPASFPGMVLQFNKGVYHYTCTRNNNFSNRSQKASLIVV